MNTMQADNLVPKNSSSCAMNPLNLEEFKRQGYMVIDFIANYYQNIEKHPVLSQVEPGYLKELLPKSAPFSPEPIETILHDIQNHIIPGITHWQSPHYFGYFPSSGSIAGFLGEMLGTGFNVVGFNWMASPAATELEGIVMEWLGEMLTLPKSFLFAGNGGGVLQGTTCEAILCTLVAARDQMLSQVGKDNIGKLVVYGSNQTHSALQKAAQVAGILKKNFRAIETTESTSFALSPDSLRSAICSDIEAGLVPLFLCATIGTTATTAVDPLRPLCDVANRYGLWVHVDAAYAGSACICPEFQHFLDGVEGAHSFSLNAHKWFFTTLDCCCLWLKDPKALTKSLATNPEFIMNNHASNSEQVVEYKDWQIALSRRFRSMKLWLVLRSYGVDNLRSFLRSHVKMAQIFEELVVSDKRFQVVVPRNFAMVCFRALPLAMGNKVYENGMGNKVYENGNKVYENGMGNNVYENGMAQKITDDQHDQERSNQLNQELLKSINASGHVYMTHAVVGGLYIIRFAVGATLTEDRHVFTAWKVVQEHLDAIIGI